MDERRSVYSENETGAPVCFPLCIMKHTEANNKLTSTVLFSRVYSKNCLRPWQICSEAFQYFYLFVIAKLTRVLDFSFPLFFQHLLPFVLVDTNCSPQVFVRDIDKYERTLKTYAWKFTDRKYFILRVDLADRTFPFFLKMNPKYDSIRDWSIHRFRENNRTIIESLLPRLTVYHNITVIHVYLISCSKLQTT